MIGIEMIVQYLRFFVKEFGRAYELSGKRWLGCGEHFRFEKSERTD